MVLLWEPLLDGALHDDALILRTLRFLRLVKRGDVLRPVAEQRADERIGGGDDFHREV